MHVEEYICSSSTCNSPVIAEGRDQCIILENRRTAATHALLRRELYGVVISNGTLTGRLRHYHSYVTSNSFFGVIPSDPACRSVKTEVKLCSFMLKLMCLSPPESLFRCRTCEKSDDSMHGWYKPGLLEHKRDPVQNHFGDVRPCQTVDQAHKGPTKSIS